jgi:hypothetical protein
MSRWLRSLPGPVRRSIYFIGVILTFFAAVGVGAVATTLAGWQFGVDHGESSTLGSTRLNTPGTIGTSAPEGTGLETTGSTGTPETTRIVPSGDSSDSNETSSATSFVHRADEENSRENYTYISNSTIDGDPNTVILVSATGKGDGDAPYGHNIGVRYEPVPLRWAIFNQDRSPTPVGAAFEVTLPQPSASFVHHAMLDNTVGNATYLNDPLTNGKPDATVRVTQNWNPGGGEGIYNDHPVGVYYDDDVDQWAVYNRDGASMPEGAAFNVAVSAGSA